MDRYSNTMQKLQNLKLSTPGYVPRAAQYNLYRTGIWVPPQSQYRQYPQGFPDSEGSGIGLDEEEVAEPKPRRGPVKKAAKPPVKKTQPAAKHAEVTPKPAKNVTVSKDEVPAVATPRAEQADQAEQATAPEKIENVAEASGEAAVQAQTPSQN
jgi:hypothetical protein